MLKPSYEVNAKGKSIGIFKDEGAADTRTATTNEGYVERATILTNRTADGGYFKMLPLFHTFRDRESLTVANSFVIKLVRTSDAKMLEMDPDVTGHASLKQTPVIVIDETTEREPYNGYLIYQAFRAYLSDRESWGEYGADDLASSYRSFCQREPIGGMFLESVLEEMMDGIADREPV